MAAPSSLKCGRLPSVPGTNDSLQSQDETTAQTISPDLDKKLYQPPPRSFNNVSHSVANPFEKQLKDIWAETPELAPAVNYEIKAVWADPESIQKSAHQTKSVAISALPRFPGAHPDAPYTCGSHDVPSQRFREALGAVEGSYSATEASSSSRALYPYPVPPDYTEDGLDVEDIGDLRMAADGAHDQNEFAHLPPLPAGWIRVRSRSSGKIYYHCRLTRETTFTEPTSSISDMARSMLADLPPGWMEMTSRTSGRLYYWNMFSNESQFEKPPPLEEGTDVMANVLSALQERVRLVEGDSEAIAATQALIKGVQNGLGVGTVPLPPNWTTAVSRTNGNTYYFNTYTGESQYELPLK